MSNRIRILHFVASFRAGGTERHVTNLVRAHDRTRFDVSVAAFGKVGSLLAQLGDMADEVVEFPIGRLYSPETWMQQLRLAAYLRTHRIQVVHAHGFYSNCVAIPSARLARVPAVLASIRDVRTVWTANQRRVERWICALAHSVVTNAEAAKTMLIREGYDPDEIVVIPNGIDVKRFQEPAGESTLRADLGIPTKAPLVGVVARVNECKGLEYFVEAAAIVSRTLPQVYFVIIGGTPPFPEQTAYRRRLEEQCRRAGLDGRLFFAGTRADIPADLADTDVAVLPSLSEGLPNAVLESMVAGVPTVATRVGGIPEIIDDEVTGILVEPRDGAMIARAIERLLLEPEYAARLSRRAQEAVASRFSLERMARANEQLYLGLLHKRAGHPWLQTEASEIGKPRGLHNSRG